MGKFFAKLFQKKRKTAPQKIVVFNKNMSKLHLRDSMFCPKTGFDINRKNGQKSLSKGVFLLTFASKYLKKCQ